MMKKTWILIASLALGAVSSQAAVLSTVTFQRNGADLSDCDVKASSNYGLDVSLKSLKDSGDAGLQLVDTGVPDEFFIPASPVSSEASQQPAWIATFTLTNTSAHDMKFGLVDLTLIGATMDGKPASGNGGIAYYGGYSNGYDTGNYNKPLTFTLFLHSGGKSSSFNASTAASDDPDAGDWNETRTSKLYPISNYVLQAGKSCSLTVRLDEPMRSGFDITDLGMGIKQIVINGDGTPVVPEPATASLSLLGLAALMMRRRRA